MKFTCLKTVFLSSEEAEKIASSSSSSSRTRRTQASILNSRRGHNDDTSSTSLKYYIQDITVNNYHFISLIVTNLQSGTCELLFCVMG